MSTWVANKKKIQCYCQNSNPSIEVIKEQSPLFKHLSVCTCSLGVKIKIGVFFSWIFVFGMNPKNPNKFLKCII